MAQAVRITFTLGASLDNYTEYTPEQAVALISKATNCYEVTNEDQDWGKGRRVGYNRPYGDIDVDCDSEEQMRDYDRILERALHRCFGEAEDYGYALACGSGWVAPKQKWKSSWRFFITNAFTTKAVCKKLLRLVIHPRLVTIAKEEGLPFDLALDMSVYEKARKMRMINSSKDHEVRPLRLTHGTLLDTLITYIPEGSLQLVDPAPDQVEESAPKKARKARAPSGAVLETGKLLNERDWSFVSAIAAIIPERRVATHDDRLRTIWALWTLEQSPRMEELINTVCAKCAAKYADNGRARIREKLEEWQPSSLGIGTLVYWAKEADPNAVKAVMKAHPVAHWQELFEKTQLPEAQVTYDSRFVKPLPMDRYDTVILQSHLGTGKTVVIMGSPALKVVGIIKDYKRVLFISGRRSFTAYAMGELESRGLKFESYENNRKQLSSVDRLFIQVESLHRLADGFKRYDLVVVDESETIAHQFISTATHREHMIENHIMFERLLGSATKVVAADAFISDRTLSMIRCLRNPAHTVFIHNTNNPYKREAVELLTPGKDARNPNLELFCQRILEAIAAKRRIVVVWTSKAKGMAFAQQHLDKLVESQGLRYRFYHGSSPVNERKELYDVNNNWRDLDVLMYTTSITVGISYDPSAADLRFDEVFLYACAASATPRDIAQSLLRCRQIRANRLTFTCDQRGATPGYRGMEEVRAALHEKKERLRIDHPLVAWQAAPEWAEENHAFNENEVRVSRTEYRKVLHTYLEMSGYTITTEGGKSTITLDKVPDMEFDEIRTIDAWEAGDIEKAKQHDEASPEDLQALRKFKFLVQLRMDVVETHARALWEAYMTSRDGEGHFWNTVREAHTTLEENVAAEARQRYVVMVQRQVEQRTLLREMLTLLDLPNSMTAKELSHAEMEALVPVMTEKETKIRSVFGLAKSRRKGDMAVSNVADLLDMMFTAWSGTSVSATKTHQKTVDGKRVKFYDYAVTPRLVEGKTLLECITTKRVD